MSAPAIAMMLFSMAVLWGGLVLAIVHLLRSGPAVREPDHADVVRRIAQERDL